MRRTFIASLFIALAIATPARAQTIRGSVTDVANSRPLVDVLITLVDATDNVIGAGVRTDSLGFFVTHTGRAGRFRIRASRIGYRPLVTDPLELQLGQLVVLRLQMTTVPQQLPTVRVVERRRLHATELMTAAGFDLRQSRGIGDFMTAEQLKEYGKLDARELMRGHASNLTFIRPSRTGEILTMLSARSPNGCMPEILLDGLPLATGASQDTLSGRAESALAALAGYAAEDLHGIEIYSYREIPPPSMAGLLGMSQGIGPLASGNQQLGSPSDRHQCGVVAIWTKNGILRGSADPRALDGSLAVQVVRGTIHNFDTGARLTNASVSLIDATEKVISGPVRLDSTGRFTIRTTKAGSYRLQMSGPGFRTAMTPPIQLAPEELVLVRLFVSGTQGVMAPMGLVGRTSPRSFAPNTFTGFAYRRERGIGGTFLGEIELQRSGARTIAELLATIGAAAERGVAPGPPAAAGGADAAGRCTPTWFVDGSVRTPDAHAELNAMPLATLLGVELYDSPTNAPEVFAVSVANDCRLILVWTTSAK